MQKGVHEHAGLHVERPALAAQLAAGVEYLHAGDARCKIVHEQTTLFEALLEVLFNHFTWCCLLSQKEEDLGGDKEKQAPSTTRTLAFNI